MFVVEQVVLVQATKVTMSIFGCALEGIKYSPAPEGGQQFRHRLSLSVPRTCVWRRYLHDVFEVKLEMSELLILALSYYLVERFVVQTTVKQRSMTVRAVKLAVELGL